MTRRMWSPMLLGLVLLSVVPAGSAVAATRADATTATTTATSAVSAAEDFESRLLVRINYRRATHGCRALRPNAALTLAARRHSTLMSSDGDLSHRLAGEPDLAPRIVAAGYTSWRMLAENLAWGQATPGAVFRGWVNSPGHRANLDNCRLRDIGIGVVLVGGRPWTTADFGRHL